MLQLSRRTRRYPTCTKSRQTNELKHVNRQGGASEADHASRRSLVLLSNWVAGKLGRFVLTNRTGTWHVHEPTAACSQFGGAGGDSQGTTPSGAKTDGIG